MTSVKTNNRNDEMSSTPVSLKEFFTRIAADSDVRFDERYTSLEKLINKNSAEAKEAVNAALAAQEKAVNAALAAAEKAVAKAEIAAEKRFDNFAENYTQNLDRISSDLKKLGEQNSGRTGKDEGMSKMYGWIMAAILFLITVIGFALKF